MESLPNLQRTGNSAPDSVVEESGALLDVFPLMAADLRLQLSTPVYFSDAFKTGGGVERRIHLFVPPPRVAV